MSFLEQSGFPFLKRGGSIPFALNRLDLNPFSAHL